MTKAILLTILIAGIFIVGNLATNEAFAAGFLKIGDIKGESTAEGHENDIDVLSWSWGETNSGTSAGGGVGSTGKVSIQDFNFSMEYNKASPKLMEFCATGKHFPEAQLILTRPGGESRQEYLTITMTDVLISSYQTGGSSDEIPLEQISLNFEKITFEYTPQKADGTPDDSVSGSASKHGRR